MPSKLGTISTQTPMVYISYRDICSRNALRSRDSFNEYYEYRSPRGSLGGRNALITRDSFNAKADECIEKFEEFMVAMPLEVGTVSTGKSFVGL